MKKYHKNKHGFKKEENLLKNDCATSNADCPVNEKSDGDNNYAKETPTNNDNHTVNEKSDSDGNYAKETPTSNENHTVNEKSDSDGNYYAEENWTFIKKLAVIAVVAFFAGIILFAVFPDKQWIALVVALPCIFLLLAILTINRIRFIIRFLRRPKKTIEETEEIAAVVDFVKSTSRHYKKAYKGLGKKHKTVILLVFGSFLTFILLMFVGVTIANYFPAHKTVGFILMGCSGGGLAIWITLMIILSARN